VWLLRPNVLVDLEKVTMRVRGRLSFVRMCEYKIYLQEVLMVLK
jgi:hypothetical protein